MTDQKYGYDIGTMRFYADQEMKMEITFEDLPEGAFERITGAVPIIKCKDCAWHRGTQLCTNFGLIGMYDDDFCSCAERKKK